MISKLWQGGQGWGRRRPVTAAWGCAMTEEAAHLVALGGQSDGRWRVLGSLQWPMPAPPLQDDEDEEAPVIAAPALREALRAPAVAALSEARLCRLSLPRACCVQGQALWPAHWDEDEVAAQVQVEAAAALRLTPQALSYDFVPGPQQDALQSWQWAACAQLQLRPVRQAFRALRMQLVAVEPAETAAQRAWAHLVEAQSALWSLAVTDWHFAPEARADGPAMPGHAPAHAPLVACGLALATLQQAHARNA